VTAGQSHGTVDSCCAAQKSPWNKGKLPSRLYARFSQTGEQQKMKKFSRPILLAGLATVAAATVHASPASGPTEVNVAIAQAVSPRVSDMPRTAAPGLEQKREKPLRLIPHPTAAQQADPVVQAIAGPFMGTTTPIGYPGVGDGDYGFTPSAAPPDPNLAVGATQMWTAPPHRLLEPRNRSSISEATLSTSGASR
jgi:hypothetical protein